MFGASKPMAVYFSKRTQKLAKLGYACIDSTLYTHSFAGNTLVDLLLFQRFFSFAFYNLYGWWRWFNDTG